MGERVWTIDYSGWKHCDFPDLGLKLIVDEKKGAYVARVAGGELFMRAFDRYIESYSLFGNQERIELTYGSTGKFSAVTAKDQLDQGFDFSICGVVGVESMRLSATMLRRKDQSFVDPLPWIRTGEMRVARTDSGLVIFDQKGCLRLGANNLFDHLIFKSDSWEEPVWNVRPRSIKIEEFTRLSPDDWNNAVQAAAIARITRKLLNDQIRPVAA